MGKISNWMRADKWVRCGMMSGRGGKLSINKSGVRFEEFTNDPPDDPAAPKTLPITSETTFSDAPSSNNSLTISNDSPSPMGGSVSCTADIHINSGGFGFLLPLVFLPDGTEILDAVLEIQGGGLTFEKRRTFVDGFTSGGFPMSNTEVVSGTEDIGYMFLGFTSPTEAVRLGEIPGAANGIKVVTGAAALAIANAMFDSRANGTYPCGFGVAFFPMGFGTDGGGLDSLMPKRPGDGTFTPTAPGSVAQGYFPESFNYHIEWENVTLRAAALKIRYPDGELDRVRLMPQIPPMS